MSEENSRLLKNSKDYRTCSIAKNSDRYIPGSEYCAGVPDTISDGDCKGRDPKTASGSIGTNKDIDMRNCSIGKNADLYTLTNQYCAGVPDTISDGDNRGRDPKSEGAQIGTKIDIISRICSLVKNSNGYTFGNEYCAGNPDTIADGDDKGREPESSGEEAGTCIDFNNRKCSLAKNGGLYTCGNEYSAGSGRV